jgi:CRISPR-associated protein Csh2
MHTVATKTESKQLSTVIATEGSDQGTFATDNRLEYALVRFHGVANENGAETTGLTTTDVERLDGLVWRALKNQTLTRSKAGHHPQLYLRVEYDADGYYHGGLDDLIERTDRDETDGSEYRAITDVPLTADPLVDRLAADAERDRIEAVHVVASDRITFEPDEGAESSNSHSVDGGGEALYDELRAAVGEDAVDVIDPYDTDER